MKKIFTKILVGYIALIVLLATFILYFSFDIIRESYQSNLTNNLLSINHSIDYNILPLLKDGKFNSLDSVVKILGEGVRARITIVQPEGKVIADSKADPLKMENHSDRPEIQSAIKEGYGKSIRHSYTINRDMLYVAIPVKDNGVLLAISRLSINMEDFDSLIYDLKINMIQIVLIIGLVALVLALVFSRTITKPVKELTILSKAVAEGNFDVKSHLKNNDELKILGDNFNVMIDKIKDLFSQTELQKEELDSIISSLQEPLVVVDKDGKILFSNNSFNLATNCQLPTGKFYWEILRDAQIPKLVKKIQEKNSNLSTEVQIRDNWYICGVNRIPAKNEIVVILHDITELKKLEIIKKDFLVNVSHELRTPLTVIKGYVETIEDDIEGENKKYIEIIKNHTNRLINIVQDLMSISQLGEKNVKLEISQVNLYELFRRLSLTFDQKLKAKNLYLEFDGGIPDTPFVGDEFKIEQMFINLIDNAIRYTENGGITLSASIENDNLKLVVSDTGIGIPEKDIDRIFERFYTVDKSRSRETAGTGLGLAIVKHIVMLHKGRISVESIHGKGSKFIIFMPLNLQNGEISE